jgi:hypothetical protein
MDLQWLGPHAIPGSGSNLKNKQGAIKDSAPLEEREIKGL